MARMRITAWFWAKLARFAYRRWATADGVKPTGVPGNRDPGNICTSYAPRRWKLGDWNDCQTDGHSLCVECCHRARVQYDDLPGAPGAAGMFSHQRPTAVNEIDQWFYEFISEHTLRFPSIYWPVSDFEAMRQFFSPWKAKFITYAVDRHMADRASHLLLAQPPLDVNQHLDALVRLTGRHDPKVVSIQLWGPNYQPKGTPYR